MKSSQGVKSYVRRKRRKETFNEEIGDKMKPIVVADFENHTDSREFKQLQSMNSSQGVKTKVGKNRRQRRKKISNDTGYEMKSIDVADFENHTDCRDLAQLQTNDVVKTSSVGKKRRRKASVGVKEKVEVKMSVDEVEKFIRRLDSWDHHHPECFYYRRLEMMTAADCRVEEMMKPWSEEEMGKGWSEEEMDEEEVEMQLMELDRLFGDSD